ncbi:hypothetical protein O181_007429 [Austropuccinia psidii MF-1]|uniref:Integrase zinc-binding domain-containing protein n=1 Tax=Austropuccinia psidii MF-1 TaxID=1389203 RepID=A0A9Q3BKV7_9BASI|nr:hypothetical protein [Austropuccinia psidii MF-1]
MLGIRSPELHTEFFNAVMKTYAKHKKCGIFIQLLQQKYRSPELESQLEEPWLRDYKDNNFFPIDGLLYHIEKHTSALPIIDRDPISLILQECHDCPYMGHMSEDRTKERVESTAWWPKWEQEALNHHQINRENEVEIKLTEEYSRKHPVFPEEEPHPTRNSGSEGLPGAVKKVIKARKIRLHGKDQRQYLVRFKNQTADKDWMEDDSIPDGSFIQKYSEPLGGLTSLINDEYF